MKARWLLLLVSCLALWIALLPAVLKFGPIVEARINPVLGDLKPTDIIVRRVLSHDPTPVRLLFRLSWHKERKTCRLAEGSWRWEVGGGALPTTSFPAIGYYADTGEQWRATTSSPTTTRSRQLYTDLPPELFSYKEVTLVLSLYYPAFCEGIFPTVQVVRIDVQIPSAEPTPLPKAVPAG